MTDSSARRRRSRAASGKSNSGGGAGLAASAFVGSLDWRPLSDEVARKILGEITRSLGKIPSGVTVRGRRADLPFYRLVELVELTVTIEIDAKSEASEIIYALYPVAGRALLLDGSSEPMHTANESEHLELTAAAAPEYVRFFLFALRADGAEAFVLYEHAPGDAPDELREAASMATPLKAAGTDDAGNFLFDAVVVYQGEISKARFAVPTNGQIEMTDDEPTLVKAPEQLVGMAPPMGIGAHLAARLGTKGPTDKKARNGHRRAARSPARPADERQRSTLMELVQILLERALQRQAQSRLLALFNGSQGDRPAKQTATASFAELIRASYPVVAIEASIPFVEETIAQIVNEELGEAQALPVIRGSILRDGNEQEVLDYDLPPSFGRAIVSVPLLVYGRALDLERVAYTLATNDVAALISCARFQDLPESLRRHTDLVLTLPEIDEDIFQRLFRRVFGSAPPSGWRSDGSGWVKHILHTDFEHPRRNRLTADDGFAYVHEQVLDRLRAVDTDDAMSLDELHGMGEAREFAEDLIADIHDAIKGRISWLEVDRGALLVGAPGTGKTTLARAIAKGCNVKFIQASAASWMAQSVSLGPHLQAIRKTFAEARSYAPSILFIDEIDSLGSREQFSSDHNSVYQTEVVNAVLEQMQGMDPASPVVVIGATNHEDSVDPALRRSGRLDRLIRIPLPNGAALGYIYGYHLAKIVGDQPVGKDVAARTLGQLSVGLTGADVERIVRGAARRARKARRPIAQIDLLDELTNKPRSSIGTLRMTPVELERTATHEAGHALASFLSSTGGSDIGFVSIVPRSDGTLGFVAPLANDRVSMTRREYDELLEVYLGGRAAEELEYGIDEVTGGASNDLRGASLVAMRMVTRLGLGGEGRLLWTDAESPSDRQLAEAILARAYQSVLRKLQKERTQLHVMAAALVEQQELSGDEVRSLLGGRPLKGAKSDSGRARQSRRRNGR